MTSADLRIGVVVVNYNAGAYLGVCIESLFASRAPLDIVVVDNHSQDSSLQSISAMISDVHRLTVIKNDENRGFSRGVNQGVAALDSNFIALINPDCTVFPLTLLKLQQALISNGALGIAGALIFNPDGSEQRGCRRREPNIRRSVVTALGLSRRFEGVDMTHEGLSDRQVEVDAVSGAAMMLRRKYFDDIGGMDEDYFLHCEDLDICRRMRDFGYGVEFCPQAPAIHRQGSSTVDRPGLVEKYKHRSMLLYYRKHYASNRSFLTGFGAQLLVLGHHWALVSYRFIKGVLPQADSGVPEMQPNGEFTALSLQRDRKPLVVVTGCKSDVGDYLLPLLGGKKYKCIAISRGRPQKRSDAAGITWLSLEYFIKSPKHSIGEIDVWINLAPMWTTRLLGEVFDRFNPARIIALSSTSVEGKLKSRDPDEVETVNKLIEGEKNFRRYVERHEITGAIVRPTLIYGGPRNQNINFIDTIVRYLRVFPLIGGGEGMRQPVHAEDVAVACGKLISIKSRKFSIYNIGGDETLSYRDMVGRVFDKRGRSPRFIKLSLRSAKRILGIVRKIPGFGFLSPQMADRMQQDLVYSNELAYKDFNFKPRKFRP